jgi:hypothetical protein
VPLIVMITSFDAKKRRRLSSGSSRRARRCNSHASQTGPAQSRGAARNVARAWQWSSRYAHAQICVAYACKAKSDEVAVVVKASREGVENKLLDAIRDGNLARFVIRSITASCTCILDTWSLSARTPEGRCEIVVGRR